MRALIGCRQRYRHGESGDRRGAVVPGLDRDRISHALDADGVDRDVAQIPARLDVREVDWFGGVHGSPWALHASVGDAWRARYG